MSSIVLWSHILLLLIGHVLFGLACLSSMLFAYHEHQIKTKTTNLRLSKLPSLSTLRWVTYWSTLLGFLGFTLGVLLGLLLGDGIQGVLNHELRVIFPLLVWGMYALFFFKHFIRGYHGQAMAIWSILSFVMVILSLIVEMQYLQR